MNRFRTLSLFLAASILPAMAFADGNNNTLGQIGPARLSTNNSGSKVTALKGTASSPKADGTSVELKIGTDINEGDIIVTSGDSAIEIRLSNGVVLLLGPGTRVRILSLQTGDSGVSTTDIALIRGSISGDATGSRAGSSFTIRSTAGVANVSGARFAVAVEQSSISTGQLTAVSAAGTITVVSANGFEPIAVSPGHQLVIGSRNPQPQTSLATPVMLALANGRGRNSLPTGEAPTGTLVLSPANWQTFPDSGVRTIYNTDQPNSTKLFRMPNSSVDMSPHGEGAVN